MFDNRIKLERLDAHIQKIKFDFINKYSNDEFPEGFKKKKFKSVVEDFFELYESDIRNMIVSNNLNDLNLLKEEIKRSFNELLKKLDDFLNELINVSFINSACSADKLISEGIHRSDAEIIVDCYGLSLSLKKKIIFVTLDKGIINCSNQINSILKNRIEIAHPTDFLFV